MQALDEVRTLSGFLPICPTCETELYPDLADNDTNEEASESAD